MEWKPLVSAFLVSAGFAIGAVVSGDYSGLFPMSLGAFTVAAALTFWVQS